MPKADCQAGEANAKSGVLPLLVVTLLPYILAEV